MSGRSETGRSRWAANWDRLNGADRSGGVDLARGLAVFGMLAAHLTAVPDVVWTDPSTWAGITEGRSSILFATIAGVSLGLMTGGAAPLRGEGLDTVRLRLIVRAALIWVLGMLLIFTGVPVYVILPAYAILFLLALPFLSLRAPVLAGIAAAAALVTPFLFAAVSRLPVWRTPAGNDLALATGWHYPFLVWIAFVLAGMAAARADVRRLATQLRLLGIGAALAVIGACLLLCRTPATWLLLPVRAVGSMPLTAYTAQLVAWAVVASLALDRVRDLAGFRALEPLGPFLVATVVGCTAWALLVGRGPVEWALDAMSRLVARAARRP